MKRPRYMFDLEPKYIRNNIGQMHSFNDEPAVILLHQHTNIISAKIWYKEGKIHRGDDKSAIIEYYLSGKIKARTWYKEGKIHREGDLPAIETFIDNIENNTGQYQIWYFEGVIHRNNNLPAIIQKIYIAENKYIVHKYWYDKGILLRSPFNNQAIYSELYSY